MGWQGLSPASWLFVTLAACGPTVATSTGESGTSSTSTSVAETSIGPASATTSTSTAHGETTTTAGGSTENGDLDSTTDAPKPDVPGCPTPSCGGNIWGCIDGQDNDGDGLVDLLDPGCIGPCDDDEDAFRPGLPGDYFPCERDCLFDGNSGPGDDGCSSDLKCDPEDPGASNGCEYVHPHHDCGGWPGTQSDMCIAFCEPFVLPGCDCFGCCTFATDAGPVSLFLETWPDCTPENLATCAPCTSQIEDCGNVCTPETCEICIGQTAPPDGCVTNTCDNGEPCTTHCDCDPGGACILGCCIPPPPG